MFVLLVLGLGWFWLVLVGWLWVRFANAKLACVGIFSDMISLLIKDPLMRTNVLDLGFVYLYDV